MGLWSAAVLLVSTVGSSRADRLSPPGNCYRPHVQMPDEPMTPRPARAASICAIPVVASGLCQQITAARWRRPVGRNHRNNRAAPVEARRPEALRAGSQIGGSTARLDLSRTQMLPGGRYGRCPGSTNLPG